MFRKRIKKTFPPGTFIPKPARIAAILQLCLAFTALIWACGYPFMGDLFSTKSKMLLYQHVMGITPSNQTAATNNADYQSLMQRNAMRFQALPSTQKQLITTQYEALTTQIAAPFLTKLKRSLHILAIEVSPYEQAWIFFSITISILILLRIEGAVQAAWLLPLLTLLYAYSHFTIPSTNRLSAEEKLFPTEQQLVSNYLKAPLNANILEQQDELKRGWKLYLVDQWAKQTPSQNPELFNQQVESGEFAFNVERLKAVVADKNLTAYQGNVSTGLLIIYLIWNIFLAWCVNYYQREKEIHASS